MNNSEFYKNANINVDDSWFQEITTSANEIVQNLVQTQARKDQTTDCLELDDDEFCEVE